MPSIESNRRTGQTAIENGQLVKAAPAAVDIAPPTPPLTNTNQANTFLRTPLPASYVQQPDQQRSWQAWGVVPQNRVPPLPPASNAQAGAQAQSQAVIVVAQTPPATSGSGGTSTVTLNVPSIFTPTTQTVTLPGPLAIDLATEPLGTVWNVLPPGLSSVEAVTVDSRTTGAGGSDTFSATATPSTTSSWGLYAAAGNNTVVPSQAGWTGFTGNASTGNTCASFFQAFSGTSPVTVSFSFGANSSETGALILFSGALPTITQQTSNAGFAANTTKNLAFGGANTAGNTLLVIVTAVNAAEPAYSVNVTDSAGNTYFILDNQQGGGIHPPTVQILIAPNCIGGANTVHASYSGINGGGTTFLQIIELTPLSAGPQLPIFAPLTAPQIPPINLSAGGNGGVFGTLTVEKGGTAANLSTTGGASQVLKQTTVGGPVTVAQLAASDLSNGTTGSGSVVLAASPVLTGTLAAGSETLTGKITNYNGIATVSDGIPAEYATIDLTAQAANIGATTLYAVPASGVGLYRVSSYIVLTTPDGVGSTLPNAQIVYTDNDSNTSVTMDATPISTSAGLGQTGALNANTAGSAASGVIAVYVKASTTIQYQTTGYLSSTGGMRYAIHIKLEAL